MIASLLLSALFGGEDLDATDLVESFAVGSGGIIHRG